MRIVLGMTLFFYFLFSSDIKTMSLIDLYKNHYYSYICNKRWFYINKFVNKREDLLSLVAHSCLKKGNLIPALDIAKVLKNTPEGRKNATYIATLFLMKKLIIQVINDNFDISSIKLPIIKDHILGKVYSLLQKNKYQVNNKKLAFKDNQFIYEVTLSEKKNLLIKIFKNTTLIKKELIW